MSKNMYSMKDMLKDIEDAAPDETLMDKICESFTESMPEEMFVVKEVPLNTDVVNSEFCIYFENGHSNFSLTRFPALGDDLPQYIRDGIKFHNRMGIFPRFVLIPFNVYGAYQSRPPFYPEDLPTPTLDYVCREYGIAYTIMVPDRLKDSVKVV